MRQNEYAVAKQLNLPIRGFERRLSVKPSTIMSNKRLYGSMFHRDANKQYIDGILNNPKIDIHYETRLDMYYSQAGKAKLWLNLDDRYTWGRYVLDAAALGVPIISTVNTGHASKLFPDFTVDSPFAIDEAVHLSQRILQDPEYAQSVCDQAWEGLQEYSPERMAQRLWKILKK
jgi:glycosyltransferase involved in cell wall biosynthesis